MVLVLGLPGGISIWGIARQTPPTKLDYCALAYCVVKIIRRPEAEFGKESDADNEHAVENSGIMSLSFYAFTQDL
jgi:hypothetical protein